LWKVRWVGAMAACLVIGLLGAFAAGCGGGDSATGSSATQPPAESEPSAQFFGKSAANHFAKFGQESSPAELKVVVALVDKSLTARAAKDWAGQCATLSKLAVKTVEESPSALGRKGCARDLKSQGENAPKSILENNIKGSVVAFRENGKKGYALYHGTDKKDWAMLMEKEGADWKVGALVAEEVAD
jgi:hypothetical protein